MNAQVPTYDNRATIQVIPDGRRLLVQFNPATLVYEFNNTLKEESKNGQRAQYATQTSGKLTIDLVYDSTHLGKSVTVATRKLLAMAKPVTVGQGKQARDVPPVVEISWGAFVF